MNEQNKEEKDRLLICGVGGSACKEHKPMNEKLNYVGWHEWADRKTRQGHKQKQCPKCGKWLFKCEM